MSINESNVKRLTTKDMQLQKKIVDLKKKRDGSVTKLQRLSKKRSLSSSDITSIGRLEKEILKCDKDITALLDQARKNSESLNKYKERFAKEQDKQFKEIIQQITINTQTNNQVLESHSDINKKLSDLSSDIRIAVQDKEVIEYDVFLSHSSLDKDIFVTELSQKLTGKGLKVFEDIKVFKIGQSQTDMMNMGILNSRFVVIFLSKNFIQSGWSQYEFKSFLNREINEKRVIILPIWHEVTVEEVRQYNPYIVDKYAFNTSKQTLDEMVDQIHQVVLDSLE